MKNSKKCILLLTTLSLLSGLTVALTLVGKKNHSNIVESNAFVPAPNGLDVKKAAFVNDTNVTINTTFYDVDLDSEQNSVLVNENNYVIISNDEDSPVRGVDGITLDTDFYDVNDFTYHTEVVCYTSYNYLDFEDIQYGAYQDLETKSEQDLYILTPGSSEYGNVKLYIPEDHGADCRYFLFVICTDQSFHINDMRALVSCGTEPSRTDPSKGQYSSYTSDEIANLPADFPFLGTGSYESSISEGQCITLFTYCKEDVIEKFYYNLIKAGYALSSIEEDYYYTEYYYQKLIKNNLYATIVRKKGKDFNGFIFCDEIYYSVDQMYWRGDKEPTGFPSNGIGNHLGSNELKKIIKDPYLPTGVSYSLSTESTNYASIDVGGITSDMIPDVYDATLEYIDYFQDIGFTLIRSSEQEYGGKDDPYYYLDYYFYSLKLDYKFNIEYSCTGSGQSCSLFFSFKKYSDSELENRTEFNQRITNRDFAALPTGEMNFYKTYESGSGSYFKILDYISSPIKWGDLFRYEVALESAGFNVIVTRDYLVASNNNVQIEFTRVGHSPFCKVQVIY